MFSRLPKSTLVLLAFASVYLFWGSTYLAIHVAGELLPVPVVSGTRSLLSATLIIAICLMTGKSMRVPQGEMWKLAVVGLLFMSGNNMLLTWGEKLMPSGFASLIVSTLPIMIALIEMFLPGGDALNLLGWLGTLLGTAGIAVLVWPALHTPSSAGMRPVLGTVVLLGAAFSFAIGSVLSRRFKFKADTFVATVVADRCGGGVQYVAGGGDRRAASSGVDVAWVWRDCLSVDLRVAVRAGGVYVPAAERAGDAGGDVCVCESCDRGVAGCGGVA